MTSNGINSRFLHVSGKLPDGIFQIEGISRFAEADESNGTHNTNERNNGDDLEEANAPLTTCMRTLRRLSTLRRMSTSRLE